MKELRCFAQTLSYLWCQSTFIHDTTFWVTALLLRRRVSVSSRPIQPIIIKRSIIKYSLFIQRSNWLLINSLVFDKSANDHPVLCPWTAGGPYDDWRPALNLTLTDCRNLVVDLASLLFLHFFTGALFFIALIPLLEVVRFLCTWSRSSWLSEIQFKATRVWVSVVIEKFCQTRQTWNTICDELVRMCCIQRSPMPAPRRSLRLSQFLKYSGLAGSSSSSFSAGAGAWISWTLHHCNYLSLDKSFKLELGYLCPLTSDSWSADTFLDTATQPCGWSFRLEMNSASLPGAKSAMNSTRLRLAWKRLVKLAARAIALPPESWSKR